MIRIALAIAGLACVAVSRAAVVGESVIVGAGSQLELTARYFRPEGAGPFPAVVVLHGSGGLWANDNAANGVMVRHFEDWAQRLAAEGYASLFIDSYTPRGLVEFRSRRPAEDPAVDDAVCSPAYERPKDAYKGLAFLQGRAEIADERIGLLAFSQGAETALASVVSASVDRGDWTMSYLKLDGTTESRSFPGPVRAAGAERFAVAVVYYPGCGFFGYFGSPSSMAANLFMPSAPTLIQHGSADPLYADNLYPERMVGKSASQAAAVGHAFNPLKLIVYPEATHSFDEATPVVGDGPETPNQTAKRLAEAETMKWFDAHLKAPRLRIERAGNETVIRWTTALGSRQELWSGTSPGQLDFRSAEFLHNAVEADAPHAIETAEPQRFFQLRTVAAPF